MVDIYQQYVDIRRINRQISKRRSYIFGIPSTVTGMTFIAYSAWRDDPWVSILCLLSIPVYMAFLYFYYSVDQRPIDKKANELVNSMAEDSPEVKSIVRSIKIKRGYISNDDLEIINSFSEFMNKKATLTRRPNYDKERVS